MMIILFIRNAASREYGMGSHIPCSQLLDCLCHVLIIIDSWVGHFKLSESLSVMRLTRLDIGLTGHLHCVQWKLFTIYFLQTAGAYTELCEGVRCRDITREGWSRTYSGSLGMSRRSYPASTVSDRAGSSNQWHSRGWTLPSAYTLGLY